MKTLFKVNWDGTYTSIERVEVQSKSVADSYLSDFSGDYFPTFPKTKKEAVNYMQGILNNWKHAVKDMKAQTKENF